MWNKFYHFLCIFVHFWSRTHEAKIIANKLRQNPSLISICSGKRDKLRYAKYCDMIWVCGQNLGDADFVYVSLTFFQLNSRASVRTASLKITRNMLYEKHEQKRRRNETRYGGGWKKNFLPEISRSLEHLHSFILVFATAADVASLET